MHTPSRPAAANDQSAEDRVHWPFPPLTEMQQRWLAQQVRALNDRRAVPWPLGLPPELRPTPHQPEPRA